MTNNYSCIIVDDEQDAIELLTSRLAYLYKNITVTATYSFWGDALEALRAQPCDLLFMDISMPGKNGIDLLKLLPSLDSEIIFVTAHDNYALDAFSFSASGYILKPIDDAQLSLAINKATARIDNKRLARQTSPAPASISDKIGIPNKHGIDYVKVSDILYLESTNKCTKIVTGKTEYISSNYLGKFKPLVEPHSFFQVHRSYIVNLNSILRYETSGLLIMSNKQEIPVARSIKSEFLERFNK
ncbi:MAG: LytTR family DNA-binding domain-containing protein [Bacteroidota bacterium]